MFVSSTPLAAPLHSAQSALSCARRKAVHNTEEQILTRDKCCQSRNKILCLYNNDVTMPGRVAGYVRRIPLCACDKRLRRMRECKCKLEIIAVAQWHSHRSLNPKRIAIISNNFAILCEHKWALENECLRQTSVWQLQLWIFLKTQSRIQYVPFAKRFSLIRFKGNCIGTTNEQMRN